MNNDIISDLPKGSEHIGTEIDDDASMTGDDDDFYMPLLKESHPPAVADPTEHLKQPDIQLLDPNDAAILTTPISDPPGTTHPSMADAEVPLLSRKRKVAAAVTDETR